MTITLRQPISQGTLRVLDDVLLRFGYWLLELTVRTDDNQCKSVLRR